MRRLFLALLILLLPGVVLAQQVPTPPQARTVLVEDGKDGVVSWATAAKLAPLHVSGAYRVIDGVATNVTVDGLTTDGIVRGGVRLRTGSHDVVFRNFRLVHRPNSPNRSPDLPEGIDIQGCTHCTFEHGYLANYQMTGLKYDNGDGLNVEKSDFDLTFRDIISENQSDSAFDWLKGNMIRGFDLTGRNSARCFKIGAADVVIHNPTCVNNRTAFELHGNTVTIDGATIDVTGRTAKTWIWSLEGSGHLIATNCHYLGKLPPESVFLGKPVGWTVDMDASCEAWLK